MLFSLITLLTVVVCFTIFVLMAKMFTTYGKTQEITFPKLPKIKLPQKKDKEKIKTEQIEEARKFNIDNYSGYNSPERKIK